MTQAEARGILKSTRRLALEIIRQDDKINALYFSLYPHVIQYGDRVQSSAQDKMAEVIAKIDAEKEKRDRMVLEYLDGIILLAGSNREIIEYAAGTSIKAIAKRENVSEDAIRKRINRGVENLCV